MIGVDVTRAAYTSTDLRDLRAVRITPTGRYSLETGKVYQYGASQPNLRPQVK